MEFAFVFDPWVNRIRNLELHCIKIALAFGLKNKQTKKANKQKKKHTFWHHVFAKAMTFRGLLAFPALLQAAASLDSLDGFSSWW